MAITAAMRIAQPNATALKIRESAEFFEAVIDFGSREGAESLHAKAFAAEAPHHGAIDDGAAQLAAADVIALQIEAFFGQVTKEASGEAIARAGGIENIFEKVAGDDEK